MATLGEQIERIGWLLQDTDTSPANTAKIIGAHAESLQMLGRQEAFPNIQWLNAVAGQALYVMPQPSINITHVLYNQRVLRYVTEASMDHRSHGWEFLTGEPKYYTTDNQPLNTFRVIPAPSRTGSGVPVIPSPLVMDMADNLVIFHTEDVSLDVTDVGDTLPTLMDWDDFLVWNTAKMLAGRETPEQNLPVVQLCNQLLQLWSHFQDLSQK